MVLSGAGVCCETSGTTALAGSHLGQGLLFRSFPTKINSQPAKNASGEDHWHRTVRPIFRHSSEAFNGTEKQLRLVALRYIGYLDRITCDQLTRAPLVEGQINLRNGQARGY